MTLTPLQEIEVEAHKKFGESTPTKEKLGEFITVRSPKMDGGILVAVGIANLIITGWKLYREEQERLRQLALSGDGIKCPHCGWPPINRDEAGVLTCKNKHTW